MDAPRLEPIPETDLALDEYLSYGDGDARESLLRLGQTAARLVPELVGMSLTVEDEDLTFTLVAPGQGRPRLASVDTPVTRVASTLLLPVLRNGAVALSISLYASTPEAFAGHREELAEAIGGSAEAAVADADLAFSTRHDAAEAPARLADQLEVDVAVGTLAALRGIDVPSAERTLQHIAADADVSLAAAARVLRHLWRLL
jgi:hypothetical protein